MEGVKVQLIARQLLEIDLEKEVLGRHTLKSEAPPQNGLPYELIKKLIVMRMLTG
jgi:hypothetical protein